MYYSLVENDTRMWFTVGKNNRKQLFSKGYCKFSERRDIKMTGKLEKMPSREGLSSLCLTKKTKKNVDSFTEKK